MNDRRTRGPANELIKELLYLALTTRIGISVRLAHREDQSRVLQAFRACRAQLRDPQLDVLSFRRAPGEGNAHSIWICKAPVGWIDDIKNDEEAEG